MGDGVLVEFASTVDAVRCAIDIRRAMLAHNANLPPNKKIEFRIGINVGDIIVEGDDMTGCARPVWRSNRSAKPTALTKSAFGT